MLSLSCGRILSASPHAGAAAANSSLRMRRAAETTFRCSSARGVCVSTAEGALRSALCAAFERQHADVSKLLLLAVKYDNVELTSSPPDAPPARPLKRLSKHAQLVEACAAAVADQIAEVAAAAEADPAQRSAAGGLRCSKCGLDFKTTVSYSGRTLRWGRRRIFDGMEDAHGPAIAAVLPSSALHGTHAACFARHSSWNLLFCFHLTQHVSAHTSFPAPICLLLGLQQTSAGVPGAQGVRARPLSLW